MSDELKKLAAQAVGLDDRLAGRLQGTTLGELQADAATLKAAVDGTGPADIGGGTRRQANPFGPKWTREKLQELRQTAAGRKQINDAIDSGELNPAAIESDGYRGANTRTQGRMI